MVSLLRKDPDSPACEGSDENENNVKLTLFDIATGNQDVFIFQEKEVLSRQQMEDLKKNKTSVK